VVDLSSSHGLDRQHAALPAGRGFRLVSSLGNLPPLELTLGLLASVSTLIAIGALFVGVFWLNPPTHAFSIIFSGVLVLLGLALGLRQATVLVLSLLGTARTRKSRSLGVVDQPTISILMPAYNESENVRSSIQSVLDLNYDSIELVVVDDGSSDDTYELAKPYEGVYPGRTVSVIRKANGGKSSALNLGFTLSTSDFVLLIDADTQIGQNALGEMIQHMADPNIDAVAGQVMVRNRGFLLTRLQALEYLIANATIRAAQSFSGSVLLVPGPIGLFRRSALEAVADDLRAARGSRDQEGDEPNVVSPVSEATFAEDFETSLRVLVNGGSITYEPMALSETRAPDKMDSLLNQRYRWIRGHLQVSRLYLKNLRSQADTKLGFWMWLTFLFDIYIMPVANVMIFMMLLIGIILVGNIGLFLAVIAGTFLIFASMFAYSIASQRAPWTLMVVTPIFIFYQTFVLTGAYFIAVVDEVRQSKMQWN